MKTRAWVSGWGDMLLIRLIRSWWRSYGEGKVPLSIKDEVLKWSINFTLLVGTLNHLSWRAYLKPIFFPKRYCFPIPRTKVLLVESKSQSLQNFPHRRPVDELCDMSLWTYLGSWGWCILVLGYYPLEITSIVAHVGIVDGDLTSYS